MNAPDIDVYWKPDREWFAAVAAIHALVVAPWVAYFGGWPLLACIGSLAYHGWVWRRAEVWRFALVGESAVLFEPARAGRPPRTATLRGPVWMTQSWVVVRTSRRVLALRAGRYPPATFARLRRALRAGSGDG